MTEAFLAALRVGTPDTRRPALTDPHGPPILAT